jgi:2-polyprenyl-3-methyl-5-hydroxy-6-metoxy-1,4-benzoquinol methylase
VLEFTGERVIPGEVDADLWNEHFSRYLFASRFVAGRTVTDIGCGAGYGSALLAETATEATGFDASAEAIAWARERYHAGNLRFETAECASLPVASASIGVATAFELIEHLADPQSLLTEARRILAPDGLFLVSTPNAAYYAESRKAAGPNPFHVREYTLAEFAAMLGAHFPAVAMFAQNHTPSIAFQSLDHSPVAEARIEPFSKGEPHFFLAACSSVPRPDLASFVYVPSSANVLREREKHIARLESELRQKQEWLDRSIAEHSALVETHRLQKVELEQANAWAKKRDGELDELAAHIRRLTGELERANQWAQQRDKDFAEQGALVADLQSEVEDVKRLLVAEQKLAAAQTNWALNLQAELDAKSADLLRALEVLHSTEAERDERTQWAISLDAQREALAAQLNAVARSRWVRIGRKLSLGPKLPS